MNIVPVILSAGPVRGLWPLSRELYPKQLLPLLGEKTMLQETLLRLDGWPIWLRRWWYVTTPHRFMVAETVAPDRPWRRHHNARTGGS